MNRILVVVADKVRARMLTFVPPSGPEEDGPHLEEGEQVLVNPDAKVPGIAQWGDTKGGRTFSGAGGPVHGYDDRREEHEDEFERRFARNIAEQALRLCQAHEISRVIVASEAGMLGFLRRAFKSASSRDIEVTELAKDLTALPTPEIQGRLVVEGLLPSRARST